MKTIRLLILISLPSLAGAGTITIFQSLGGSVGNIRMATGNPTSNGSATTYTFKQSKSCNADAATGNCAFTTNVTAHSTLIVGCIMGGATTNTMSVTDNNSNVYTPVLTSSSVVENEGTGVHRMGIWKTLNANAGATTITCADTGSTAVVIQTAIHEYGTSAGGLFDNAISSVPLEGTANPTIGPMAIAGTGEMIFSMAWLSGGAASGATGTIRENYVNNYYAFSQDYLAPTSSPVSSSFTASSGEWGMIQAAFK